MELDKTDFKIKSVIKLGWCFKRLVCRLVQNDQLFTTGTIKQNQNLHYLHISN